MKAPYDEVYEKCPICDGSGFVLDKDGDLVECEMCEGSGEVERDNPRYKEWLYDHYGPDEDSY